jgi:hypothetical protein
LISKYKYFNCICVVYSVYSKYLGRDEMGIQRYNGRGKIGLGKWGNGRRYLGRDEMDIQRENGVRETGACTSTFLSTSPSLFFFGVWHSWNPGRSCWTAVTACSDSGRRILVTQVPTGYAFKLPNNDNKKKKITKFSHSHKEINRIYQSIPNLMRQANKEMNPATASALS